MEVVGISFADPGLKTLLSLKRDGEIIHEVETIAHSVGVNEPRQLRRRHVRIMQEDGTSRPMHELMPGYSAIAET